MNAYDVLFDHHNTLRGLCKQDHRDAAHLARAPAIPSMSFSSSSTSTCASRTNLFYPAVQAAASKLVAISHAEHRQMIDQLTVVSFVRLTGARLSRRVSQCFCHGPRRARRRETS